MRKRFLAFAGMILGALVAVPAALATGPPSTLPAIPVDAYGSTLLTQVMAVATTVLPWAAAFTAVAIGFGFLKGYIGRRKATSISH